MPKAFIKLLRVFSKLNKNPSLDEFYDFKENYNCINPNYMCCALYRKRRYNNIT